VALHLTSSGKTVEKLEWAFALYDVDRNGSITKNEIHEIVKVNEDQLRLSYSHTTKKVLNVFSYTVKNVMCVCVFFNGIYLNR